jgi:hypothetical protein
LTPWFVPEAGSDRSRSSRGGALYSASSSTKRKRSKRTLYFHKTPCSRRFCYSYLCRLVKQVLRFPGTGDDVKNLLRQLKRTAAIDSWSLTFLFLARRIVSTLLLLLPCVLLLLCLYPPPCFRSKHTALEQEGGGVRFSDTGRQPDALQQQQFVFYAGRPTHSTFIQLYSLYARLGVLHLFSTYRSWLPFRVCFCCRGCLLHGQPQPPLPRKWELQHSMHRDFEPCRSI